MVEYEFYPTCFVFFSPFAKAWDSKTHISLDKNHIQLQTMRNPTFIFLKNSSVLLIVQQIWIYVC